MKKCKSIGSRVEGRGSRARCPRRSTPRSSRRGVLLLVVLSLLVLFMLIGTAFLMSSNQYRHSAKASAQLNRVGNYPTKSLDRALMQVLRDTESPDSAIRSHSLLRDIYGTDGFEAQAYVFSTGDPVDLAARNWTTRFAGAAAGSNASVIEPVELGPTQGQFIDIYVKQLQFNVDSSASPSVFSSEDPDTTFLEGTLPTRLTAPDARHVIKLERDPNGVPQQHVLPLTKGYYNGALLTITGGPAAGQSTRVLEYDFIEQLTPVTRLFRFRVMNFPRSDGSPLQINSARSPEIGDLAGATFIVNGRPFNGTGTGFNELAVAGQPRLTAREGVRLGTVAVPTPGSAAESTLNPEIALTPNAAYHFTADPFATTDPDDDLWGARYPTPDPSTPGAILYLPLNPKDPSVVAVPDRGRLWKYQNFNGPGDADESYDAADYQNMALALQTVSPRSRGRYVQGTNPANPLTLEVDDPAVSFQQFLRLDLEDLPLPSFHRPDLVNYWFHRLMNFAVELDGVTMDEAAWAVLAPYGADGIRDNGDDPPVSLEIRDQIVAIKRKISLRPLREDHPNFDGSNPSSRPLDLDGVNDLVRNGNIAVPFWEAVGPWDVDNDNDGVPDSNWVDLGDPVAQAEDGTLYKPMYAFLIVDLDSKLNVNAHGLADHVRRNPLNPLQPPPLDSSLAPFPGALNFGNLAHDTGSPATLYTSNFLPSGTGYGPAEISLRPILSPNLPGNPNPLPDGTGRTHASVIGNPANDDYARILAGRPATGQQPSVWGRHGSVNVRGNTATDWTNNVTAWNERELVRPSIPYNFATGDPATVDRMVLLKFIGYPWWPSNYFGINPTVSAFSTPPDMLGQYALGLDYVGQPVVETRADHILWVAGAQPFETPLLFDSPYELNLADPSRRELPDPSMASAIKATPALAVNDDAPFATAELERIARAHDADAGALPDRLWNVVDAFDPLKLRDNQPALVQTRGEQMFRTTNLTAAQRLAAAQQIAAENRRSVTTDSYDLPVLATSLPGYVSQFGPDGQPGRAGVDDDGDGVYDNVGELDAPVSDDLKNIVGKSRAQCTILDLLRYRVWCEMRKQVMRENSWDELALAGLTPANYTTFLTNVTNRTDALMNGEPFVDANANGVWDQGETFTNTNGNVDFNNNPVYDPPLPQQILAPEILAGKKMNLNRPFGDGRDNGDGLDNDGLNGIDDSGEFTNYPVGDPLRDPFMNGIVDDPAEAGEPFLDMNGNGKRDDGSLAPAELWIDVNANGIYDRPLDRLWEGITSELIAFDYTNGHGEPLHGEAWTGMSAGGVRKLNSQGRQLFARHLYCLMLLLMDENYLEMPDLPTLGGGNLNLQLFLMKIAIDNGGSALTPTPVDVVQARGRLTAQRVAQWAINVADQRDTDSIMTAFEYDENPFDGWGCVGSADPSNADNRVNIPLDGDIATDENFGWVIDWNTLNPTHNDTSTNPPHQLRKPLKLVNDVPPVYNRTRNVVWGAERPELLITETLATHDRRCTDEPINGSVVGFDPNEPKPELRDYDLDQRLKPRGSLYVELYNPWTADGNRPREFYGSVPGSGSNEHGVMLNKLSDQTDPVSSKRSPVWRMSVVREPLNGRLPIFRSPNGSLDSGVLEMKLDDPLTPAVKEGFDPPSANDRQPVGADYLTIDPDGYNLNMDEAAERHVYFTTGRDFTVPLPADTSDVNRANDDEPEYEPLNPNSVGDWQFKDAAGAPLPFAVPVVNQLSVRVPPLPQPKQEVVGGTTYVVPRAKRYFIARNERVVGGTGVPYTPNDKDITIAPILPGRYAVIGSSGLQLRGLGLTTARAEDGQIAERFVLPMSRDAGQAEDSGGDALLFSGPGAVNERLSKMRRIELWPNAKVDQFGNAIQPGNPNGHQVLVSENGGHEFVRIDNANVINVTDPDNDGNPSTFSNPNQIMIDPAVAIPVEDLNISEPVEGYPSITYRKLFALNKPSTSMGPATLPDYDVNLTLQGDLEFSDPFGSTPGAPAFYDRPLDVDFELVRNGTTQNYRSLHLQRLANPSLPWNPLPFDSAGNPNPLHRPWLPVNPYRTIDSQSVDLTAYNGASLLERTNLPVGVGIFNGVGSDLATDRSQSNILAPIAAEQFKNAPDHEILAMLILLTIRKAEGEIFIGVPPLDDFAKAIDSVRKDSDSNVEAMLAVLEEIEPGTRGELTSRIDEVPPTSPPPGAVWQPKYPDGISGGWQWHMQRRTLPDDHVPSSTPSLYRQWLHFKSLERGYHASNYFKYPKPGAFYASNPATLEGWAPDLSVVPRTLWKQERPNARLFVQPAPGGGVPNPIIDASDLLNVTSWGVLSGKTASNASDAEKSRNQLVWNKLDASTTPTPQPTAVFDYVMEQTLGFANRSYTPDLERVDGEIRGAVLKNAARPGAPEVATVSDQRPANPLTYGTTPLKEIWNSQREASKLATAPNPPTAQPSLLQAVVDSGNGPLTNQLEAEFYERRRQLTASTFPWLAWNDRPLTSAEEIMNVSASPSSIMLRDFTIPNFFTANAYDGDPGVAPNLKTVAQQVAAQKAPFGHLLNFFAGHIVPAKAASLLGAPEEPTGAPHFQRILDYVEVPSRYVGTETVLTPEIFNDVPFSVDTIGTDIANPADPRTRFQPPFNLVSNQRDPGRVNLNTVTGRRGTVDPVTGSHRIWSDVYDGIMHRHQDGNLMNPLATSSVLQLSHFGPAWRDVALSRRGYAQYNADNALTYTDTDPSPVETVAFKPETYSMGLSRDFPSVFSNPFRSSDAGDLVPLPNMLRPGAEATLMRGHHWHRVFDPAIIANPFSATLPTHPRIAWGLAGVDDDANGIVDDVREAGFGDALNPNLDGDPLKVDHPTKALQGGGIPLFSEQVPEPAIDAERNSGMMYQPMTRLGNLVTTRSNVYAIWITVGYFEVEKAPDWNDANTAVKDAVRAKFGGTSNDTDPATIRARALYDRVYPEGYMLGEELGTDTGSTNRQRAFYIIDRTEPVGFKPGEDLNVENMIRVRRRIE